MGRRVFFILQSVKEAHRDMGSMHRYSWETYYILGFYDVKDFHQSHPIFTPYSYILEMYKYIFKILGNSMIQSMRYKYRIVVSKNKRMNK